MKFEPSRVRASARRKASALAGWSVELCDVAGSSRWAGPGHGAWKTIESADQRVASGRPRRRISSSRRLAVSRRSQSVAPSLRDPMEVTNSMPIEGYHQSMELTYPGSLAALIAGHNAEGTPRYQEVHHLRVPALSRPV